MHIDGGLGNQSVGTDQPVIKGLDRQRQNSHFRIGDGNAGNNLVLLSQVNVRDTKKSYKT